MTTNALSDRVIRTVFFSLPAAIAIARKRSRRLTRTSQKPLCRPRRGLRHSFRQSQQGPPPARIPMRAECDDAGNLAASIWDATDHA